MKFTINKKTLIDGVNTSIGAISNKSQIPVLNGIYLNITQEGITLIGSNGDITIRTFIPATDGEDTIIQDIHEGSVVLQAKLLNSILRKLPEQSVSVEMDEGLRVIIKSGKSKFKLNGMDAAEYPKLPNTTDVNALEIESNVLKDIINQTVFAVSIVETRPILTGVNFKKQGEQLKFVATDSHRLSQIITDLDAPEDFDTTIPGISLKELNKVLPENEVVKLTVKNNMIFFEFGTTLFFSRILDGNYPETDRLIPNTEKTTVKVSNKELTSSLERALVLSDKPIVKLSIDGGIMASITSNTPEVGNLSEDVVLENFEGEDVVISFSAKFALEALKAIKDDNIIIGFNGPMRPFTFKAENDESTLQLVLPVRTV
ncbi:DNA polymerase III subunit beta [Oceanobacillus luteolus]|uniref:Beta sliding clamp n=1 Tax=Oceanobacillus luteolus TaxID=1274358 RepID=A0ABW4HWN0_9BACI